MYIYVNYIKKIVCVFCVLAEKMANGFENWLMEISSPLASVANDLFSLRSPL